jgi:hypothetical protein
MGSGGVRADFDWYVHLLGIDRIEGGPWVRNRRCEEMVEENIKTGRMGVDT